MAVITGYADIATIMAKKSASIAREMTGASPTFAQNFV
jgi:hypothetical protein